MIGLKLNVDTVYLFKAIYGVNDVIEGFIEEKRAKGRPRSMWIDDIKEWPELKKNMDSKGNHRTENSGNP